MVSLAIVRRPPSRIAVFIGAAVVLIALGLYALRPLFQARPSAVTLKVGQKRALPLSVADPHADVDAEGIGVLGLERDARRRLLVVAKKVGKARLRIFADAKLLHTFEIEVVPAPLRKIEITPLPKKEVPKPEVVAKKPPPPPPPPKKRMREVKPEPDRRVAELPDPKKEKEPEKERTIILPEKKEKPKPEKQPEPKKEPSKLANLKVPVPPAPEKEKLPDQKKEPFKQPPPGKKAVELDEPNKKKPTKAKYLAQEDSAVEKETRAKSTTLIKTKPGEQQPDEARGKDRPGGEKAKVAEDRETAPNPAKERKLGREKREYVASIPERKIDQKVPDRTPPRAPKRAPLEDPRSPGEIADRGHEVIKDDMPSGPPRKIRLYPSAQMISQVLKEFPAPKKGQSAQEEEEGEDGSASPNKGSSKIATKMPGGQWRKIWQRVQGFLENFIPEVSPGTHTSLNAQKSTFAAYIARAHRKIHVEWGFGLWSQFRDMHDPGGYNPMQSSIITRLEIKLDKRGRVTRIGIVRTSGSTAFDGATMASVLKAAPFGAPPEDMVSRDGSTYLHWNFYQDGRQCWTNDVQVFVNDS